MEVNARQMTEGYSTAQRWEEGRREMSHPHCMDYCYACVAFPPLNEICSRGDGAAAAATSTGTAVLAQAESTVMQRREEGDPARMEGRDNHKQAERGESSDCRDIAQACMHATAYPCPAASVYSIRVSCRASPPPAASPYPQGRR